MARAQKTNADMIIPKPPHDPPIADQATTVGDLTDYDRAHLVTYMRLLDADAEGTDWVEVVRIVLHIDSSDEPERAQRAYKLAGLAGPGSGTNSWGGSPLPSLFWFKAFPLSRNLG